MHDLDTIKRMNNESGEHLTGKAQTLAEIQAEAREEADVELGNGRHERLTRWPERNEH